jgi:phosphoribosylaminoimidazolecarboxamide formyltransferase/IMP cyclohydrolase
MIRAAAKNHADVAIIVNPADYTEILVELNETKGALSSATRFELALKSFEHTARYDTAIATYLSGLNATPFPQTLNLQFYQQQTLRYGENPHQNAAFYVEKNPAVGTISSAKQLQGKELSYNNIADADSAWECVKSFTGNAGGAAACVIIKHANPCGVAVAANGLEAYQKAFKTDPSSAFGGIIALNVPCDGAIAEAISKQFVEVLIAPSFSDEAKAIFAAKQNVRLLEIPLGTSFNTFDFKRVGGGLLVQSPDAKNVLENEMRVVSKRLPTPSEMHDMMFAWRVAKFVKSNAIVYCANGMTLGIGAGQMSRVDSARMASIKAENAGLSLKGSAVASDAFFPFRDGLDVVVNGGASCAIQPGGSMRDDEIIAAANEHGIAMIFTGTRHFRH